MIEVSAQELCRTRDCATPGCEGDAEAGSALCFECGNGNGQARLRSLLGATEPMPLRVAKARRRRSPREGLLPKDLLVLQSAADGQTMKKTATELSVSVGTVKQRRHRAKAELDANTIIHAVAIAIRTGLIH